MFYFRSLNSITGWIKICLSSEQKKSDFKPETDVDTMTSQVRNLMIIFKIFSISFI